MTKLFLVIAPKALAFASGTDLLAKFWLGVAFLLDFIRAIYFEGLKAPNEDFRNLTDRDFDKSEYNIKLQAVRNIVVSAIFFGIGFLAKSLNWL